jgi:hypothetical protein
MQAVYTAGDASKLTLVQCAAGIDSVLIANRSGATLLIQTVNAVQDASVAASAAQLLQTAERRIYAADCNASPSGAWSFGVASAGAAVADLTARAL